MHIAPMHIWPLYKLCTVPEDISGLQGVTEMKELRNTPFQALY
jgi:hypothetical protein